MLDVRALAAGGHGVVGRGRRSAAPRATAVCSRAVAVGGAQLDDHDGLAGVAQARPHLDVAVTGGL